MLGGFLGSGKTTTLLRLALELQRSGKRVGLITNDQAQGLVDTALVEELDLPVREITGGCFCCRSETLVDALSRLTADKQPEVFLAEPVGSCTDLIATVSKPLEQIYKAGYVMAPYAVLVDPFRAEQTLGMELESSVKDLKGRGAHRHVNKGIFSPDVAYIYRKQLEEAEIIVINKVDVMAPERVERLKGLLEQEYPGTPVLTVASRAGLHMEGLFERLSTAVGEHKPSIEVDYERYGRGEALLGWVNLKVRVDGAATWAGNAWLMQLVQGIGAALNTMDMEVAHLKATLASRGAATMGQSRLAAVQWVRSDAEPEYSRQLAEAEGKCAAGEYELLVNLRAEGDPEKLAAAVLGALTGAAKKVKGLELGEAKMEHFRPGQPNPTHRVA